MRELQKIKIVLIILLAAVGSACNLAAPPNPPDVPVTVQLNWLHYPTFAGLYAADQNGDYAAAGLKVQLIPGGSSVDFITPVVDGQAQFGAAGAENLIQAHAQGKPVRAIAVILRRSPFALVSLADSGITRPQDFVGKTIRVTPQILPGFHAMMRRVGVSPDQYTEVVLPSDVKEFASGKAQVWAIFTNSFAITLKDAGYQLNFIYPDDYGVHFYADCLYTTDDLIARNPDLVLRFLRASLKGYTYVVENPEAIGPLLTKYNPATNVGIATDQMNASLPLINTGEDFIGWMKPEVWAGMEQTLRQQGVLTTTLDIQQVYSMQFLEKIYK